ncbi:MAG: hypothetical protein IIC72_10815 [Acidobacteria bacterium]|nr:hypothetical protein [Acidobacteriota bacterium]
MYTGASSYRQSSDGPDAIVAFGGDDVIKGKKGADIVCGMNGNDQLKSNGSNDWVNAGRAEAAWHNRRRLHSALGYQSPTEWEDHYRHTTNTMAA